MFVHGAHANVSLQNRLAQSAPTLQCFPSSQAKVHVPPQSTSVSSPSAHASGQPGSAALHVFASVQQWPPQSLASMHSTHAPERQRPPAHGIPSRAFVNIGMPPLQLGTMHASVISGASASSASLPATPPVQLGLRQSPGVSGGGVHPLPADAAVDTEEPLPPPVAPLVVPSR
jgi:hypothetical protein